MRFLAAGSLALLLCGCRDLPVYPVPEQSPGFEDFHVRTTGVVDLGRPAADEHIVRDIVAGAALPWRWTLQRPAVKVKVGLNPELKYVIDFTIPFATFKDTGPVTIAFTVNDHVLDRVRYTAPGPQHYAKAVPPDWIRLHSEVICGAEIDKVWVSKDDGARLGFILSRIGLVDQ